jgi:hypothetical protein
MGGMNTVALALVWLAVAGAAPVREPMTLTPMTRVQLLDALREGHFWVFGEEVNDRRLAMAWSQVATENAQGAVVFNHNLGNVGLSTPTQSSYLNEGDRHVYGAFVTAEEGAEAYWAIVQRCPAALEAFDVGDAASAAAALKECRYFEADVTRYARRLSYLYEYAAAHVLNRPDLLVYVEPAQPPLWKIRHDVALPAR